MPHELKAGERREIARADIRQAVMTVFCNALHEAQLPPLSVIELVAEAVGSIYREVADAHRGDDPCPCGWRPSPAADVASLQAAIALLATPAPGLDLSRLEIAGRA